MATHSRILAWEIPGQKGLTSYSPWGHKESDMTEQLSTRAHIHTHTHTHTHTHAVNNSNHAEKSKCFPEPNMAFSLSVYNVIIFIY